MNDYLLYYKRRKAFVMADEETLKKLPLTKILKISIEYFRDNLKPMMFFTLANLVLLIISFQFMGGYSNPVFLIWAIIYYVFWCYFFRFYFKRKPYLIAGKIFDSLIPSTKILVLTLAFGTLLAVLPFAPLFMGLPLEFTDKYTYFLKEYMQESKVVDCILNLILILVSPIIFYRPFFAWISSVIGRSGLLKTAFAKTEGNYWHFVGMVAIFDAAFVLIDSFGDWLEISDWILMFFYAPLTIFFNIVVAKSYDFFFLDNLDELN